MTFCLRMGLRLLKLFAILYHECFFSKKTLKDIAIYNKMQSLALNNITDVLTNALYGNPGLKKVGL